MKKQLIAGTAALAMASPAAVLADSGPDVYGFLNLSVDYEGYDSDDPAHDDGDIGMQTGLSHFGIRGSEELDGGLSAVYQGEIGFMYAGGSAFDDDTPFDGPDAPSSLSGNMFTQVRDSFVGLEGDFGRLTLGRQAMNNQYVYDASFFVGQMGGAPGVLTAVGPGGSRLDTVIRYETPQLGGPLGTATFSVVPNKANPRHSADDNGDHAYNARLTFAEGPLTGAATVWSFQGDDDAQIYSLGGKYDLGMMELGAQVVTADDDIDDQDDTAYTLGASIPVGPQGSLNPVVSHFDSDNGDSDFTTVALKYDHSLSDRTTLYGIVASTSNDDESNATPSQFDHYGPSSIPSGAVEADETHTGVSLGIQHVF